MCQCTPGIRTPYCGKPGCEWPGGKPGEVSSNPTEFDGKIVSFKDAMARYKNLEGEIADLTDSIKKLRGDNKNWEDGARNDNRRPVQLLYKELMAKRMAKTLLELAYMYGLSSKDVDNLNHGHAVGIRAYPPAYNLKEHTSGGE